MTIIGQYKDCSTHHCSPLDRQLIAQIERIAPNTLARFDQLPVKVGAACHPYLQAPAVAALQKAIATRGQIMIINSAYRTLAQQAILHSHCRNGRCGIKAAAVPGNSNHNTGLALDIEDAAGWRPYLERFGWDWVGSFDPMHFDYEGRGARDLRWLSIKAFQYLWNFNNPKAKIAEDGQWGPRTEKALLQTSIAGFSSVPGQAIAVEPKPAASAVKISSLREGASGIEVKLLRQRLRQAGFMVAPDGVFDASLALVIRQYQAESGLVADGVVGMATKKALGFA